MVKGFAAEEQRLVSELSRKLTLPAKVGRTPEEFWRAVATALNVAVPHGSALSTAKALLEHLGETWDDDFEAGELPTLTAYEALVDRIGQHERDEDDDEEDDDATGELANEQQIQVTPTDTPIQTYISFIEDGTLDLDPEWQRSYVWRASRRRRLIESIFLKLPIPPVLLFKDKAERYYVIDGRQRLETIYRFAKGSGDKKQSFSTFSKKTPGWRDGERLNEAAGKRFDKLPEKFQRLFKTTVVNARVFENLERKKLYEIFRRYNTGGDKLNAAEIRNAVYQGVELHKMIYKLGGEGAERTDTDDTDRWVAAQLRNIMKKKTLRYGAYNFIGRVLAFAHLDGGSVANAVNKFMEDNEKTDPNVFRLQFATALKSVIALYPNPLCADIGTRVVFHEWVATIQMVSGIRGQEWIQLGRTTQDKMQAAIEEHWAEFLDGKADNGEPMSGLLQAKQNTGAHWAKQKEWLSKLENAACQA